jgi:hypothetical protein
VGSCSLTIETSCFDSNPAPGTWDYYAVAVDRDPSTGSLRDGAAGARNQIEVPAANQPPTAPPTVSVITSGGLPEISWGEADDPDGHQIRFYRIYRNGTSYAHRYDKSDGLALTYTDRNPGSAGDTYYVSAVDELFNESEPQLAVAP